MIKEDPSTVYHINAKEEGAIGIDNLQPVVITEGLGESSGTYGIMPLSDFLWLSLTTCVIFGVISLFF